VTQEDLDRAEEEALDRYRSARAAVTAHNGAYREAVRTMERLVAEQDAADAAHEAAWEAKRRGVLP
jgi:hypothetical protein